MWDWSGSHCFALWASVVAYLPYTVLYMHPVVLASLAMLSASRSHLDEAMIGTFHTKN